MSTRKPDATPDAPAGPERGRYAADWNEYSRTWDEAYGTRFQHLGDEWNDDDTGQRERDAFYFRVFAERWLSKDSTVLEVGPGGGKWTVQLAQRAQRVIALDVAEAMLERTRRRCAEAGFANVETRQANGRDFAGVGDESIDFFFSYDVFVHIALEDVWAYAQETARVLAPGGRGACHYAVSSVSEAWDRIEQTNDWYRGGQNTLGQYYYYSPEALRRMYERCGLRVLEQHLEGYHCTLIFEKPSDAVVARFEALLRQLSAADTSDTGRSEAIDALAELPQRLEKALQPLLAAARAAEDAPSRRDVAARIRRMWRGV